MTEPPRPPSPHQAGLPVDGIVHDEHFVLIPGPFFFLQRKKLKMSTSDAALEIKDRAETVQGQTWEALVTALLLLPCNPSLRVASCWGPAMSHLPRDPLGPFYTHIRTGSATLREHGFIWNAADPSPSLPLPAHQSSPEIQGCCRSLRREGRAPAAEAPLPQGPGLPTFFFFFRMTFTPSTDTMRLTFFFLIFLALNSYCRGWKKTPELAFLHRESPREG